MSAAFIHPCLITISNTIRNVWSIGMRNPSKNITLPCNSHSQTALKKVIFNQRWNMTFLKGRPITTRQILPGIISWEFKLIGEVTLSGANRRIDCFMSQYSMTEATLYLFSRNDIKLRRGNTRCFLGKAFQVTVLKQLNHLQPGEQHETKHERQCGRQNAPSEGQGQRDRREGNG